MEPGVEAAGTCADLGTTHNFSLYWGCRGAWLGRGLVSREGQTQDEGRRSKQGGVRGFAVPCRPPHPFSPLFLWCFLMH